MSSQASESPLPAPTGEANWTGRTEEELLSELQRIRASIDRDPSTFTLPLFATTVSLIKAIFAHRQSLDSPNPAVEAGTEAFLRDTLPLFLQYKLRLLGAEHLAGPLMDLILEMKQLHARLRELDASGLVGEGEVRTMEAELSILAKKIDVYLGVVSDLILIPWSWECCAKLVHKMAEEYRSISPALLPIHTRLLELKKELTDLKTSIPSLTKVQAIQRELAEIDSARMDGKWIDLGGSVVPGQATVLFLLEECFADANHLLGMREPIDGENPLRAHYEELITIKATLEEMLQEVAEDDLSGLAMQEELLDMQQKLGAIDNLRSDGKFLDPAAPDAVPEGQAVMHFLLHKNYRMVHRLQTLIPWIDESLHSLLLKLGTLRKCLTELVKWKVELSREESLPYQMKLSSILRALPPLPAGRAATLARSSASAAASARARAATRLTSVSGASLDRIPPSALSSSASASLGQARAAGQEVGEGAAEEGEEGEEEGEVVEGLERVHLLAQEVKELLFSLLPATSR